MRKKYTVMSDRPVQDIIYYFQLIFEDIRP